MYQVSICYLQENRIEENEHQAFIWYKSQQKKQVLMEHSCTKKLNPIPIINYPEIQKNEGTVNLPIKKPKKPKKIVYRVLGGEGIYNIDRRGCSAGFWVRFQTLELLVTAGHCPGNTTDPEKLDYYHLPWGGTYDFRLIGSMIIRFTQPVDRGFIIRNSTRISATPFITYGFGHEYSIAGTELPDTEGAIVCKSGYHSEVSCGTLFAIYGNLIHADGTSHDNVIIIEGMECVRGDSGGPAFTVDEFTSNVNLVGMVFGGIIENNIPYCFVHPVSAILLEGMEVITIYNTIT
ncbi:hypothetical protein F8M41_022134 [Gigaspora margarita]|uniref:Serine protease n=1 Tax=Gigaspora margarita TaxID=4874 RepID=A0A8H4AFK2_GIGMA|nr:hypothetical protein F8M41_022134 [Gigaspora margarita]